MASVTMPAVMPTYVQSPLTAAGDGDVEMSRTTERRSPLPPPLPELNSSFVFPPPQSSAPEQAQALLPPTLVPGGGSQGRRAGRQGRPVLPDFNFNPGAGLAETTPPQSSPSPRTHPILEEMAANSRNLHAVKGSTLPPFSFNPGVTTENERTPSPTRSTHREPSPRTVGHRRCGSELVGVDGSAPSATSSHATEEIVQARGPPISNHPPRGHRHRRSGALSVAEVDLSSIIKANAIAKHRPSSTPSTPGDAPSPSFFEAAISSTPASPTSRNGPLASPPGSPRRGSASSSLPRSRVAFSETVAEIPRPLSMISSETEGSCSTIRATHSASGSVNSFSSPARPSSSISITQDSHSPPRPKTAGPLGPPCRKDSIVSPSSSPQRPASASGTPSSSLSSSSPPSKKKHFWGTPTADKESHHTQSCEDVTKPVLTNLSTFASEEPSHLPRPRTSPERKASIKKRKVRTWTGGIFGRKGKQRSHRARCQRTPTPPMLRPGVDDVFDNDDTVVLEELPTAPPKLALLETQSPFPPVASAIDKAWTSEERNVVSPVIDLDAALGPFGSDERFSDSNSAQAAWRRLHSGRGLAEPSNPYHRRAESAPHLPPPNRNFGFNRMGSNPSMSEEVFDEEEEDDYLAGKGKTAASVGEGARTARSQVTHSPKEKEVKIQSAASQDPPRSSPIAGSLAENIEIVDEDEENSNVGDRSSSSTILPPVADEVVTKQSVSIPVEFTLPMSQRSYASSADGRSKPASMISSPEADHVSFDSQQLRVPRHLGEPFNEHFLRGSSDDVPSLTDSVSTATGHVPRISSSGNTRSSTDQRSASFSGFGSWSPGRASKRASLVSLTRLIPGSSHGSKLRFGESVPAEEQQKQRKRKSNRLSRLVTFWRPKEKP